MNNIAEIVGKIIDACKSDALKIFVVICACLYILGFSFNIEGYNINYANLVINLYIALFCSYAWERVRKELPSQKEHTVKEEEATVPAIAQGNPTSVETDETATKAEKRNLLLNHRISIAQYDIHTAAMMFISIPNPTEDDYTKLKTELEGDKQRFFMEYCWVHQMVNGGDVVTEDIRTGIYEVYNKAFDELKKMFDSTTSVTERVYGLNLIQNDMSKSLSEIFKCDEIIEHTQHSRKD